MHVHDIKRARADRPHYEQIFDVFAKAVKPRMTAELAKLSSPTPSSDLTNELCREYAQALAGGWLRNMRLAKEATGDIAADAVMPAEAVLSEYVAHFPDIDNRAVLNEGLKDLAAMPGDVVLPLGLTIKRSVFDAALNGP